MAIYKSILVLGSLNSLTKLWMDSTHMHGPLPDSLGSLRHLTALKVSANNITGPLPRSFGSLSNLVDLYCNDLHLTGRCRLAPALNTNE